MNSSAGIRCPDWLEIVTPTPSSSSSPSSVNEQPFRTDRLSESFRWKPDSVIRPPRDETLGDFTCSVQPQSSSKWTPAEEIHFDVAASNPPHSIYGKQPRHSPGSDSSDNDLSHIPYGGLSPFLSDPAPVNIITSFFILLIFICLLIFIYQTV